MSEKIIIDILREKKLDEFSRTIADNASKAETGSAAAMTAALAASLLHRAASICDLTNERLNYIERNIEIIRSYMIFLVDEDVKCRGPLRRALKEGDPLVIEACFQPACAICSEIISMMRTLLDFALELKELCNPAEIHFVAESAELAYSTVRVCAEYILSYSSRITDETNRYVTKRENEVLVTECGEVYRKITEGIPGSF